MLSENQINDFRAIYNQLFGADISYKEASAKGTQLLSLVNTLYKPIKKSDYQNAKAQVEDYRSTHSPPSSQ